MESEDDRGAAAPAAPLTSPAADAAPGGMPECAQSLAAPIPTVTSTPFPAAARTAQESTTTAPRSDSRPWSSDRNGDRGNDRNGTAPAYGALDLGTNNCRLLVARPSRRGFMVVDAFSRIIRLGEGVSTTGRLSDAAMHRTIEALKICESKLRKSGVVRSRLIATQACRVAANGEEFLERFRAARH
jgi:exopolyphosphatase/guanosine-5'-triphosphate,3'-diphosphate pyrophosphatase